MGWSFRKSRNFGPFRINLSRRGVGWSIGRGGLRLGSGAPGALRQRLQVRIQLPQEPRRRRQGRPVNRPRRPGPTRRLLRPPLARHQVVPAPDPHCHGHPLAHRVPVEPLNTSVDDARRSIMRLINRRFAMVGAGDGFHWLRSGRPRDHFGRVHQALA